MYRFPRHTLLSVPHLVLVVLLACRDEEKPSTEDDTASTGDTDSIDDTGSGDTGSDTSEPEDTGTVPADPPCSGDSWGSYMDEATAASAIHVREDGSDDGDGSPAAPFATMAAAVAASREVGAVKTIFVGPGTFDASLSLADDWDDLSTDEGLAIYGCGQDETTLEGADDTAPVIQIARATGIQLAGMTLAGGRRSLTVWQCGQASALDMSIIDGARAGVMINGSCLADMPTTLTNVEVHNVIEDTGLGGGYGVGFVFQSSYVIMSGGGASAAVGVGILVDGSLSQVEIDSVTVSDTMRLADDHLGRGIQIQDRASASITNSVLSGNSDAGIFAVEALSLTVSGVTIRDTYLADIEEGGQAADGIVVSHGDPADTYKATWLMAELFDNQVEGAERAGILLSGDGLEVTIEGNSSSASWDPSGSSAVLVQGNPTVLGTDEAYDLTSAGETLQISYASLATDDLTDLGE